MEFVPLWTDIIDRPNWKILDLPPDLYRFWTFCLLAAQKHNYIDGILPDQRTLIRWLGMDRAEAEGLLARLVTAGLVDCIDGGHQIHDWPDWRTVKDSGAVQRQRERRAKLKAERDAKHDMSRNGHGPVTGESQHVTDQHSSDSIQHSSNSIQKGGESPAPDSPPAPNPKIEAVVALAERKWNPLLEPASFARDLCFDYDPDWVKRALIETHDTFGGDELPRPWVRKKLQAWFASGGPRARKKTFSRGGVDYTPTPIEAPPPPSARTPDTPPLPRAEFDKIMKAHVPTWKEQHA